MIRLSVTLVIIFCSAAMMIVNGQSSRSSRSRSANHAPVEQKSDSRSAESASTEEVYEFRGPKRGSVLSRRVLQDRSAEQDEAVRRIWMNMVDIPGTNFKMGRYEITQGEWTAIMGADPSNFDGDNLPVENVSVEDCELFIAKLNRLSGRRYRLPTRTEWIKAATGQDEIVLEAGKSNTLLDDVNYENMSWYAGNSGNRTHDVGSKTANMYGLFDMNGNVQEWCVNDDQNIKSEVLTSGGAYDCEKMRLLMEAVTTAGKGDRSSTCGLRLLHEK